MTSKDSAADNGDGVIVPPASASAADDDDDINPTATIPTTTMTTSLALDSINETPSADANDAAAAAAAKEDEDDDDDIEALASKACALASVPVPDYAASIERENILSKAKYGNRFTIDDNEEIDDDEEEVVDKFSSSGMALAEKTSQILSNFQDYVSGIAAVGDSASKILEGSRNEETVTFLGGNGNGDNNDLAVLASKVRDDNKNRIIRRGDSTTSSGSGGGNAALQREWANDGYSPNIDEALNSGDGRNFTVDNFNNRHETGFEDWDGMDASTIWTNPDDVNMLGRRQRQKYTHPFLQSDGCKIAVFTCLVIAAVGIGVGVGVANSGKGGQEANELEKELGKVDETGQLADEDLDWWTTSEGTESGPKNDEMGVPIDQENIVGTIAEHTPLPESSVVEQKAYENVGVKFKPMIFDASKGWTGKTYKDAFQFCTSQIKYDAGEEIVSLVTHGTDVTYSLCPYEALCPLGPDTQPFGGYRDAYSDGNESWMPIMDAFNEWAQTSRANACERYSFTHPPKPDWGTKGGVDGEQHVTSHLMCCVSYGSEHEDYEEVPATAAATLSATASDASEEADNSSSASASKGLGIHPGDPDYEVYKSIADEYLPLEFDRSDGWEGRTFIEALQFCRDIEGYQLCRYTAICPFGHDSRPLTGYKDERKGSWAPILDRPNEWVQIGLENSCVKYSNEHPEPPTWGVTGEGSEETTRHILCCLLDKREPSAQDAEDALVAPKNDSAQGTADVADATDTAEAPTSSDVSGESPAEDPSKAYEVTAKKYMPVTYSRSDGWKGQSYVEAADFCLSKKNRAGKVMKICPYAAVCPLGGNTEPMGGHKDGTNKIVPIEDGVNAWVQVGEVNSCQMFPNAATAHDKLPERSTQYVMCCAQGADGEEDGDANDESLANYNAEKAYQEVAMKYHPMISNRDQGWSGQTYLDAIQFCSQKKDHTLCPYEAICPLGPGSEPLGGHKDANGGVGGGESWYPYMSAEKSGGNAWVHVATANPCLTYSELHDNNTPEWGLTGKNNEEITRNIICCLQNDDGKVEYEVQAEAEILQQAYTNAEDEALVADVSNFHPIMFTRGDGWDGQTYHDAVSFCSSKIDGYEICPFDAICPMGQGVEPLGGYIETGIPGQTWVPVSDDSNEFVNLSPQDGCKRYSALYNTKPDWGMSGVGSEPLTQNIMCCEGSVLGGAEESFLYQLMVQKYHPIWFDRNSGWDGQDYADALMFCSLQSEKLNLCPYEAYCPMADLDVPLGGSIEDEPNGSWAPIRDSNNSWISISPDNTCQVYGVVNGKDPEWGITGENEELTRHIMCCEDPAPSGENTNDLAGGAASATSPKPASPTATPKPTPKADTEEAYKAAEKYNPKWYDRQSGWEGQTYDAATLFCSKKGANHDVCPYEVLCPGGPSNLPYGGAKSAGTNNEMWAPINNRFNSWTNVAEENTCVQYGDLKPNYHPQWGLTGKNSEDRTRHVLCCEINGNADMGSQEASNSVSNAHGDVVEKYSPKWFDRDDGWDGQTYVDAVAFCAAQNSYIPCPYEAYCPNGEMDLLFGGYDGTDEAWAAIMDIPNGFVQIGIFEKDSVSHSCMKYNSLYDNPPLWGLSPTDDDVDRTPKIMCCKEPENHFIDVMDPPKPVAVAKSKMELEVLKQMDPVWFSSKHGYHGTTYQNAAEFCKSIGDMVLCPKMAYCPSETDQTLFLQKDPFEGEQWAPAASEFGTEKEIWVSIGQSPSTCSTHEDLKMALPEWATDGSQQEIKENVLCCQKPSNLPKRENMEKDLNPIWMDASHGWEGGSHDDATEFCEKFGQRQLCPYSAYCPHGPGQPVMGGHDTDFDTEGEQWAPVYGTKENHWVMIGEKYQNRATTCMDSEELEGEDLSWGLSKENASMKKYIMCCSF